MINSLINIGKYIKSNLLKLIITIYVLQSLFSSNAIAGDSVPQETKYQSTLKVNIAPSVIDTNLIDSLIKLSWELAIVDVDSSIAIADSAIKLAELAYSPIRLANALNNKGEALRYKGLFEL